MRLIAFMNSDYNKQEVIVMLFQAFGKIKQTSIMISIVLIAVGVIMLLCPPAYVSTLVNIFGYIMLVMAAVMVFDFIGSGKKTSDYISFSVALIFIMAGIAILVFSDNLLSVLSIVFGALLVLDGVHSLIYSVTFARRSGSKWWPLLLGLSILQIAVGLLVIINPWWTTAAAILRVIGCATLLSALVSVCRVIIIWPFKNEKGEEI